ncbi:MAG: major facilitator superfamily 1 [Verrucomicrobiales bacterium]|nr:major facilitator superfamily 1 [Verrucomicrobiales bacterium]
MTRAKLNPAWVVVGLLWVVALLNYLDRLMITTMRDPIVAAIPMSDAQFGLLTSVFLWVYGSLSPLGGFLADRFSRSKVIMASLLVWSVVTWLTGHVKTFDQLLWTRAVMGVSEACYIPAALALISDYHRGSTRSLATGLHMSGVYTGAALGGIGGFIAELYGWRVGFSLFGVIGISYAIVLIFCLRDSVTTARDLKTVDRVKPYAAAIALFSVGGFWVLLALNALVGVANWGINGWLPTYLKDQFHLGLGSAGLSATAYIQTASFLGVLIGGVWADRWARRNGRGRMFVPAIGYLIAGPCLFLSGSVATLAPALAGLIVFGLARGFFDANHMPILRQLTDERYSATGYGVLNFVSCSAGGIMIFAGGMLKDAHVPLSVVFQLSAAGLVIVGILLLFLKGAKTTQAPAAIPLTNLNPKL